MADLFTGVLPFVRTAELRSFGRAATSLGISTAAVSKAVRKLEDELGVKLLDRSSRVVAVTREGAEFLARCGSRITCRPRAGTLAEVLAAHATEGPSIHALSTASRARSPNVRTFIGFLVEAFR